MSGTWNVCEWRQPKRQDMWAATSKTIVVGPPKPSEMNISPSCILDATFGAIGLKVCLAVLWSGCGSILFNLSITPFLNRNLYFEPLYLVIT